MLLATEQAKLRKGTITVGMITSSWRVVHAGGPSLRVVLMIEIDAKEFRGDRDLLAKFLQEKLKVQARVERNRVRIGDSDQPRPDPSLQEVKDQVKRALHHMRMDEYHVVVQAGVVSIRERKARQRRERRKGAVPSVQQTVPYFFPG
jgi:hypothetical protein